MMIIRWFSQHRHAGNILKVPLHPTALAIGPRWADLLSFGNG